MPIAFFGIESSGLNLAVDLLILFVAVLYLSLIYWTFADARRRIEDPILIYCATAAAVFPFVGPIIYVVLRPPEYLEDVHERELETQAAEARLHQIDQSLCPHCDYRIEADFVRCPSCLRKLKERCVNCSRPLDQTWTICPYCEADVPGIGGSRSRRRRAAPAKAGKAEEQIELERPLAEEREAEPTAPAAPVAAAEGATRTRPKGRSNAGRSTRPGGRARPT
ncbi:MAG TPA: zinc ribbon domain-containing protein [Solirubrobacteraceae bacterium]